MNQRDTKEIAFWKGLFSKFTWKLQINLSVIFILMISIFALLGGVYTSISDKKQLKSFASIVTKEVSQMIHRSIGQIVEQTLVVGEAIRPVILNVSSVDPENLELIKILFSLLGADPYVQRISIGAADGAFLSVLNLLDRSENYFHFNTDKLLPKKCFYALRAVIPKGANKGERWIYYDRDMNVITTEFIPEVELDPREYKWYKNVVEYPRGQWQQEIKQKKHEREIAYTVPVVNENLDVVAAIKIVLSLDQISNLLSFQRIGKSGWAVILDSNTVPLAPSQDSHPQQDDLLELLRNRFPDLKSMNDNQNEFYLGGKEYLIRVSKFPLGYETCWYVVTFSQFADIIGPFLKAETIKNWISLFLVGAFAFIIFLFSKRIALPIEQIANFVKKITNLDFEETPKISSRIAEIVSLSQSITGLRSALISFSRYVPKEVVKAFITQGQAIDVASERRELTILFSDIQNFTMIAETISSELLTKFLSEYFGVFSKIIVTQEGTIDKYIGDSVMAFWNAPNFVSEQGQKACFAALAFKKMIGKPDEKNQLLKVQTRFGIHSGEVLVGNIGTSERMNYTVVGNAVNTASRLESLNKTYGTTILISESTHEKIGLRFITRPIDFIVVQGRTQGITVFELLGLNEDNHELSASKEERELSEGFSRAFRSYQEGRFEEAKNQFDSVSKKFPSDMPTKIYIERLQAKIKS